MAMEHVPVQEVIEVRVRFNFLKDGALKSAIDRALLEKPPHRIVAISTFTAGAEATTDLGAIIVVEYV